jgi:hypothetical protein
LSRRGQLSKEDRILSRIRPELSKGVAVIGLFLVLIVTTSYLQPHSLPISEYTFVDLKRVGQDPLLFDQVNISSTATVESIILGMPPYHVFTLEEVDLQYLPYLRPNPEPGDRIYFRGTVYISNHSRPIVVLHEFYILDYSSSIIRSIPGIIMFVAMFFYVFRVDFKHLAFVLRRKADA